MKANVLAYIKIIKKILCILSLLLAHSRRGFFVIKRHIPNIGQTLSDINDSNIFSDPPTRVLTIKRKISKWDLIKLKSFCTAKKTSTKQKDNAQNGRKSLQVNQLTRD